ncbi:LOW QUALITY PROTEIN: NEDD8 ultimate buster 1-like [Ptychodera flava]|uniref:LOW QUALITY PROTEIN: NEDD8 ultimate buster 1-like n=1 Tax=Ptychodera flava TaxID=63121 RepID=UPI003969FB01
MLSDKTTVEVDRLKLISCGHVVEDNKALTGQHIKHQSQVMVICLSESEVEVRRKDEERSKVQKTRHAAEVLVNRKEDGEHDDYYLQIADHTGKPINLPAEERKALALAMTLNEKGRAALKRKQYGEALLLLLEADSEFKQCRADILNAVDNYAVLCLDISWCYLCLKNINDLPDAESRLKTCEECLKRSYGESLERLTAVKGDSSRELALFVRLYLLQGVVAFYQGRRDGAWQLLERAQAIWRTLQVDSDKLSEIMALGFTEAEARLGLRTAHGNIERAVMKITDKREERKQIAKKEAEERKKRKLARKLGKTADGQKLNIDLYETLLSMGFPKSAASTALRQSNNDINLAIQTLNEHPELLTLPDTDADHVDVPITDAHCRGNRTWFSFDVAKRALQRHRGDVQKAVNELIARGGILPPDEPSSSSSTTSSSSASSSSASKSQAETEEEKEAVKELVPDIAEHEEDYLDLALDEEGKLIEDTRQGFYRWRSDTNLGTLKLCLQLIM